MSTGVDCTLWIDGVKVADGSPTDRPGAVAALSGLQVTFGRDTVVDQPAASTCSFQLLDEHGGDKFPALVRTGKHVEVRATGTTYVDPDTSTITDPSFDDTNVGQSPPNVTARSADAYVVMINGHQFLRVKPWNAAQQQKIDIMPAEPTSSPAGWDHIPKLSAGQTWTVSIDVEAFEGAKVTMYAVAYPSANGEGAVSIGSAVSKTGTGDWITLSKTITSSEYSNVWVGIRVYVYPPGPTWEQSPYDQWEDALGAWRDLTFIGIDNANVFAPSEGIAREVLVYAGRITDITAAWDEGVDGAIIDVTTSDFTADLDNIRIGDEPWPAQTVSTRFNRILTLADIGVTAIFDPTGDPDNPMNRSLGSVSVAPQDADSKAATSLLQDLVQSVDGVMWSAVHTTTGPYIHVEDQTSRPDLLMLTRSDEAPFDWIVGAYQPGTDRTVISSCDVLRDPVEWTQSVSDVSTRVTVGWQQEGTDDDGNATLTDKSETVIDTALEAELGQRGISVSTQLESGATAANMARRILERTAVTGWRLSGLTIDDDALEVSGPDAVNLMLTLLDGTLRNGLAVTITDLPSWSPVGEAVGTFLEGGTYSFEDGRWILELTVSRPLGTSHSVTWAEMPLTFIPQTDPKDYRYAWDDFDPSVSWSHLWGVAAPVT